MSKKISGKEVIDLIKKIADLAKVKRLPKPTEGAHLISPELSGKAWGDNQLHFRTHIITHSYLGPKIGANPHLASTDWEGDVEATITFNSQQEAHISFSSGGRFREHFVIIGNEPKIRFKSSVLIHELDIIMPGCRRMIFFK